MSLVSGGVTIVAVAARVATRDGWVHSCKECASEHSEHAMTSGSVDRRDMNGQRNGSVAHNEEILPLFEVVYVLSGSAEDADETIVAIICGAGSSCFERPETQKIEGKFIADENPAEIWQHPLLIGSNKSCPPPL